MKKTLPVCLILLFGLNFLISAQDENILFFEGFESGAIPLNWKETYETSAAKWKFQEGGYTFSGPSGKHPLTSFEGSYNAMFNFINLTSRNSKLVTCPIDMRFAVEPELHFYHAQMAYMGSNDKLYIYYKNGASAEWQELTTYTEATTSDPEWVERIVVLPDNESFSANYYLMFKGVSNNGYGTCLDNITVLSAGVLNKSIDSVYIQQASTVSIASGSVNAPVLRLKLKVMGNSGTCPFNSLVLNSLNTSDEDIDSVKLFFTENESFNRENQIGKGKLFDGGTATFTGLNYNLPTGYSYVWVAYDIKSTAEHRNIIDGSLNAESININGEYFPAEGISPQGSRTILQTVYFDDFEGENNWTLSGEFELNIPEGLGGTPGNPDPTAGFSGTKILGTDLTGLGSYHGNYEKYLMDDAYKAVSDTFDFTYYNDVSLRYRRYLNIEYNDKASIDISTNNGSTWTSVWTNTNMILDDKWTLHEIDISNFVSRKKNVRVRYSLGPTNDYWQLSGWNIDDFGITGNYITNDVGISSVISPVNGCGHTTTDSVTVIVTNYGDYESGSIIPLQYSFDNNLHIYTDTLKVAIPKGQSKTFTFKTKINLSIPGKYSFVSSTKMIGDEDNTNNGFVKTFYIQPTFSGNHNETFESIGGLWMVNPQTVSSWEWGTPSGITPPSGSKVWKTKLNANYLDNDSSFVESFCYTNETDNRKILHMKYWMDLERDKDGVAIHYSTNNGSSWQILDTIMTNWHWYNDTIQTLDSRGWSGTTEGQWNQAGIVLPRNLTDSPLMKFRMAFASDAVNNSIGFAFDNFNIFKAPMDLGASAIADFADACQYINPDSLTITITNFGINSIEETDTIIAGFDLNNAKVVIDTFHVSEAILPGQTFQHTFSKPVAATLPGVYSLTAYTLTEDDPWFYQGNNDSLSLNFEVYPAPTVNLFDTIQTREPDTVVISPFYHADYDYLWHDNSTLREYHVTKDGWQTVKVTATRGNGCYIKDSTYVELLFNDAGAENLIYPVNHCGLTENEFLTVSVKNYGTDSIASGQKIAVVFQMNGGLSVADTLKLTSTLYSKNSIPFTFDKGAVNLSEKGLYNFKIYTSYGGDTIAINDTILKTVEILGRPTVDLGPDITVKALSHTLDAGTGFTKYEWDNGESERTRQINESGSYWVQVFDENMCDNFDTAYVRLKIRDVQPGIFESPLSDCNFTASEPVTIRIINSGTDTIPASTNIALSYKLGQESRVNNSMILSAQLLPGASVPYTFTETLDMSNTGDYVLEATASVGEDLRLGNDTSTTTIYRYPKPVVDFGLEKIARIVDISVLLDAGYSPYYTYDWQDTATMALYTVTANGLYHVRATDTRTQCYDRDTVTVFLIYEDVGITWSDMPVNGCTGKFDNISVRVANLGPAAIGKNAPIYIACDIDGSRVTIDTLEITEDNFYPEVPIDLEFSGKIAIQNGGVSRVAFYTVYSGDKKKINDTLVVLFNALPAPVIDFGDVNGVLNDVTLPHILDAGTGNKSYLWQDNSTLQIFEVLTMGEYSVTVTGANDCQTSKTVKVNMPNGFGELWNETGNIDIYPNPSNGLFRIVMNSKQSDDLTVRILNNQGQIVYVREFTTDQLANDQINVQEFPNGMYHIIIQSDEKIYRGKIVIQ